jgi:hypothetical protein
MNLIVDKHPHPAGFDPAAAHPQMVGALLSDGDGLRHRLSASNKVLRAAAVCGLAPGRGLLLRTVPHVSNQLAQTGNAKSPIFPPRFVNPSSLPPEIVHNGRQVAPCGVRHGAGALVPRQGGECGELDGAAVARGELARL